MKDEYTASFRFPTAQFAYMEVVARGTKESLLEQYREFECLLQAGEGIAEKEFDGFIQRQLENTNTSSDIELHEKMTAEQRQVVNRIKRAKDRILYKLNNSKES